MDQPIRPDLGRILPRPWLRRTHGRDEALAQGLNVPAERRSEDYLVDVERKVEAHADDPGFGIQVAQSVAKRVGRQLAARNSSTPLLQPDAQRTSNLLADD